MNSKYVQKLALKASIKKWKKNLKLVERKELPILGGHDCPCCRVYKDPPCEGCPVFEYTGNDQCYGTPYGQVCNEAVENPDWRALKAAVVDEVHFLEKVLNSL